MKKSRSGILNTIAPQSGYHLYTKGKGQVFEFQNMFVNKNYIKQDK